MNSMITTMVVLMVMKPLLMLKCISRQGRIVRQSTVDYPLSGEVQLLRQDWLQCPAFPGFTLRTSSWGQPWVSLVHIQGMEVARRYSGKRHHKGGRNKGWEMRSEHRFCLSPSATVQFLLFLTSASQAEVLLQTLNGGLLQKTSKDFVLRFVLCTSLNLVLLFCTL